MFLRSRLTVANAAGGDDSDAARLPAHGEKALPRFGELSHSLFPDQNHATQPPPERDLVEDQVGESDVAGHQRLAGASQSLQNCGIRCSGGDISNPSGRVIGGFGYSYKRLRQVLVDEEPH
jgi:hypothetical protein